MAKRICERFDEARAEFYDEEDLERGFVRVEDRKGELQDIPLVSMSVGIASSSKRRFAHYGEAVAVATEMKSFAKRDLGSSYAVDRRRRRIAALRPTSLYWVAETCSRGGAQLPTGGDSPRPRARHARVDPVQLRDRP